MKNIIFFCNLFIYLETLRHAGTGVRNAKQKQDHEKDNYGITNSSLHPDLNNNSTGILKYVYHFLKF